MGCVEEPKKLQCGWLESDDIKNNGVVSKVCIEKTDCGKKETSKVTVDGKEKEIESVYKCNATTLTAAVAAASLAISYTI